MRLRSFAGTAVIAMTGMCLGACQYLPQGAPSSWDQFLQAADTAVSQKKFDEAEKFCQSALDDAQKNHADDPTIFVIAASHYAEIETSRGKYKEAEQLYGKALKLIEHRLPPDNPEIIKLEKGLAQVLTKDGKDKEAKQLLSNRPKLIQKAKADKAKQDKSKPDVANRKGAPVSRRGQRVSHSPAPVANTASAATSSASEFASSGIGAALQSMPVAPVAQNYSRSYRRSSDNDARHSQEAREREEREENERRWSKREQELRDMNRM